MQLAADHSKLEHVIDDLRRISLSEHIDYNSDNSSVMSIELPPDSMHDSTQHDTTNTCITSTPPFTTNTSSVSTYQRISSSSFTPSATDITLRRGGNTSFYGFRAELLNIIFVLSIILSLELIEMNVKWWVLYTKWYEYIRLIMLCGMVWKQMKAVWSLLRCKLRRYTKLNTNRYKWQVLPYLWLERESRMMVRWLIWSLYFCIRIEMLTICLVYVFVNRNDRKMILQNCWLMICEYGKPLMELKEWMHLDSL